ncbi:MAG: O-antigen ligase family protein, partial [Cyanobacteria bacterium J06627_3]
HYDPPRSLYGLLTGKSELYVPGAGNSNYLIPYFATDESFIHGFVRYVYFFSGPEALALIAGFTSLLALELKPRIWSIGLFAIAIFILLTSGTRSVVIVLPLILIVHGLFSLRNSWGTWFLCLFLATLSFTTLSMPPITNYLFDTVTNTVEAVGETRADSTEVRGDIYRETLDGIMQGSNRQFFGGHVTTGKTVLPGYDPARIGSHSFWLGTLLYRSGVIGSFIFVVFWLSLIWITCRRSAQSLSICRPLFILLTVSLIVMEIEMPVMAIALLCVVMQDKSSNSSPIGSNYG